MRMPVSPTAMETYIKLELKWLSRAERKDEIDSSLFKAKMKNGHSAGIFLSLLSIPLRHLHAHTRKPVHVPLWIYLFHFNIPDH